MRLDKFLSEVHQGSRSQVKALIRQGLAAINGRIVRTPDTDVDETKDTVTLRGQALSFQRFHYYMLNKPQGLVSATEDAREKTVLDLFPPEKRKKLFPAGRLDKDTEGLLLITDDGALAHNLLSPRRHVDKTYLVAIERPLTAEEINLLEAGVDIGEKHLTKPSDVKVLNAFEILLTIQEGKFHQVKRMLQAVDNKVMKLKRISFGGLTLDEALAPGEYRELTKEEVNVLYEHCRQRMPS